MRSFADQVVKIDPGYYSGNSISPATAGERGRERSGEAHKTKLRTPTDVIAILKKDFGLLLTAEEEKGVDSFLLAKQA